MIKQAPLGVRTKGGFALPAGAYSLDYRFQSSVRKGPAGMP